MAHAARLMLAPLAAWLAISIPTAPAAHAASAAANGIAEKFSGTAPKAAAPAAPRGQIDAEANRRADEAEMLARARAEAEERASADTKASREAARNTELARLSEKLRRARSARDARIADQAVEAASNARAEPAPAPAPVAAAPQPEARPVRAAAADDAGAPIARLGMMQPSDERTARGAATRFTVLLVMAPGRRGIRRFNPTGDPVLCTGGGCYVSGGLDQPARFLAGRKALGFANTFGRRAGACEHSLGCVFRDVEIDPARGPAYLQPVDLHVLRHDRREAQLISSDSQCRAAPGRITCARGIDAGNYALWIVPEHLAELGEVTQRGPRWS